jgi:hypothetical protein
MTDRIEKARQLLQEALQQYREQIDDMIPDVQQAMMAEIEGPTREELGVAVPGLLCFVSASSKVATQNDASIVIDTGHDRTRRLDQSSTTAR